MLTPAADGFRLQHGKFRAAEKSQETSIECNKMASHGANGSGDPSVRNIICAKGIVEAKLAQRWPLAP